jgi:hypothetical protein
VRIFIPLPNRRGSVGYRETMLSRARQQAVLGIWQIALLLLILPLAGFAQRTYVGSDRCGFCHPLHSRGFKASVHANRTLPGSAKPAVTGCEELPRAGVGARAETRPGFHLRFQNESPEARSNACLACHASTTPN